MPDSHRVRIARRHTRSPACWMPLGAVACAVLAAFPVRAQTSPAVLPGVDVVAGADEGKTEGTQRYTTEAMRSATGLQLAPRETPQSVSVITRQQLDDQNIRSVDEALATTTGVTSTQTDVGARTNYRARGFNIVNYKVDGLSMPGAADFSGQSAGINLDLYDHVEVVRGANGLMGGSGDPSATINLVRKRPGATRQGSVGLQVGSWANRRVTGDISLPSDDGRFRSRFVLSGEDSDTFRDRQGLRNVGALASFEFDLSDATTVGAGVQYERNRTTGASWGANVPIWYADGSRTDFSRRLNPAANWSQTEREGTTYFASLDQRLGGRWHARLDVAHTRSEALNNFGVVKANLESGTWGGLWARDGSGGRLNGFYGESEAVRNNLSLAVSGPFTAFGREHELLFGMNGYRTEDTSYTFSYADGNCNIGGVRTFQSGRSCQYRNALVIDDWRTWDGSYASYSTHRTDARTETVTENYGAYLAGRFSIADPLKLIAGARVSRYKTYADTHALNGSGSRGETNAQDVVTPYAGLVFDLDAQHSLYASYADVFNPQTNKDVNGAFLDPITGKSYEAGAKGEWLGGALNGSFAVFKAVQKNVAQTDGANLTPDGAQAYVANGTGVRSEGFELELAGRLSDSWNVFAGYTNLGVDNRNSAERPDPRHVLRLYTTYRLPGQLNRLTVGGGASLQSHTVSVPYPGRPLGNNRFDASPLDVPGYTTFNAMARYQINDALVATLNISNLFDKTYYRQFGFYNGLIYGEPRRITLTLRGSF